MGIKFSVFTRSQDNRKTAFSKDPICRASSKVSFTVTENAVSVRTRTFFIRLEKDAFSKISGHVWTGPERQFLKHVYITILKELTGSETIFAPFFAASFISDLAFDRT